MTGVAADMRAGDAELFAQQMDQQHSRLGQGLDLAAVDLESDLHLGHRLLLAHRARSLARVRARSTMTPAMWVRKSAGPRPSADGFAMPRARRTASATAASSRPVPITASAASLANSGVSATLVSAIAAELQALPDIVRTTAAAAVA